MKRTTTILGTLCLSVLVACGGGPEAKNPTDKKTTAPDAASQEVSKDAQAKFNVGLDYICVKR